MVKRSVRVIALCLTVAMLLGGCNLAECARQADNWVDSLGYDDLFVYSYEDMVYERPDMEQIGQILTESCELAAAGENLNAVVSGIYDYYDAYDSFYTNFNLANIRYCGDMTDSYWEEEYNYCLENSPAVDAWLEDLYCALAASPLREELESDRYFGANYFDAYEGEGLWNEAFIALMEQEAQLQNEYYELSGLAMEAEHYSDEYFTEYGAQMGQLYVELVKLRHEIAACAGYDSYVDFAYDFYYSRDFTPEQTDQYVEQIREELVPLYRDVMQSDLWDVGYEPCTEEEIMEYLRTCARRIGGNVAEAFYILEEGRLYDISYGEYKYNSSFEVYLDSYYEPFIFMNSGETMFDKLTLAHEFGHFANDYLCGGSLAGVDVSEVMSQGMEYMSLCYGDNTEKLEKLKLIDGLCTYVEQAAYASFEQRVYEIDPEELTEELVYGLYEQVGLEFGFDSWEWDSRDFVMITHFFTHPMYVISYVVSGDVALQLYQMEKADLGAGRERYQQMLENGDAYFLAFVEDAGMESPFAEGRLQAVRQTVEAVWNDEN